VDFQPASLEKGKIDSNTSGSANVSATSLEPAGAPPPLATNPPGEAKAFAGRKTTNDETNATKGAAGSEVVSVSSETAPSATDAASTAGPLLNAGEPTESKLKEKASVSATARNSSVEASRPEGSPVNLKPPDNVTTQKAAIDYYHTGLARLNDGDVKGAVEAYLASIKLEPKSAQVFFSLGSAYLKLDKNNDAAKALKQAVKLNPDLAEAQYGLGLAFFRLKRYPDAVAAFKKATNLSPKMAKAHFGLGAAYNELRETDSMLKEYRILEELDKDLAKKLAQTFPSNNLGCRLAPLCR
jgi:tetratricopeptide (TPR) repeat protein